MGRELGWGCIDSGAGFAKFCSTCLRDFIYFYTFLDFDPFHLNESKLSKV